MDEEMEKIENTLLRLSGTESAVADSALKRIDYSQKEWQNEPSKIYIAQLRRMIRRVIDLAGQPAPTAEAVAEKAEAWAGAMWGEIPEDRLMDAFNQALKYHDTVYSINAHEVILAWKEIAEAEARIAEKRRVETIRDRALEAPQFEDCPLCHGCGFKPAPSRGGYPYVARCYQCSYWLKRDAEREANPHRKVAK